MTDVQTYNTLTESEKATLTKSLETLYNLCGDEYNQKKDLEGEKNAVQEDEEHMRDIREICKKFDIPVQEQV